MDRPGCFSAVATTRAYVAHANERWLPTAWLPLPCAVLSHRSHDLFAEPVAIVVPRFEPDRFGGTIHVDGVFRSDAPNAWRKVERGLLGVSIVGDDVAREERDGVTYLTDGVLIAVDLVERPLNRSARITSVTPFEGMTEAQRDCQRRFDEYLLEGGPRTIADFHIQVDRTGIAAMNRLKPIVRGLTSTRSAV